MAIRNVRRRDRTGGVAVLAIMFVLGGVGIFGLPAVGQPNEDPDSASSDSGEDTRGQGVPTGTTNEESAGVEIDGHGEATRSWARARTASDVLPSGRFGSWAPLLEEDSIRKVSADLGEMDVFVARKGTELCLLQVSKEPLGSDFGLCGPQELLSAGPVAVTTSRVPGSSSLRIMGFVSDRVTGVLVEVDGVQVSEEVQENFFNVEVSAVRGLDLDPVEVSLSLMTGDTVLSTHRSLYSDDPEVALRSLAEASSPRGEDASNSESRVRIQTGPRSR